MNRSDFYVIINFSFQSTAINLILFLHAMIIDTHTHLYLPEFKPEIDSLIADALKKDVSLFLLPNINSETIPLVFDMIERFPEHCFAMMGLHPCDVKENYKEELDKIFEVIHNSYLAGSALKRIVAIGEIGLDFYWDKTFVEQQLDALRLQLNLSRELNLPVSLHTRNATQETIELIRAVNSQPLPGGISRGVSGVFHCFGGTLQQAVEVIELGMYIGIGGVVTFKNSGLDKIVEQLPLDKIVLETDAPYLAPAPHRGKRNLPEYLFLVAEKIAAIKNISVEEVKQVTSMNASRIFNLQIS